MPQSKNGHQRKSLRLPNYDYSQEGAYFITLVTNQRKCLFGFIYQGEMQYYPAGKIVKEVWQSIPDHFPHVTVDHFVIMPNHIHGIINIVGARHAVPLPIIEQFGKPVARSIPTIIRSFKSEVTRQVNLLQHTPGAKLWQRNFYEHVIRNEEEYETIYEYMLANPQNWEEDTLYR